MMIGRRAIPVMPAIMIGAMLAGAVYAGAMGDDANWDWRNYHSYNVWATINGRYDIDAIPPGFQTYFNPLIYYPVYGLRHFLSPLPASLIMGALHGLNLVLIYRLTRVLLGNAANGACLAAAVLLAAFGPMTLSEVGTSFADILLSLPVIASLILVFASDTPRFRSYFLAGALAGATVGLKLTNVVFAIGLFMAVLASARPVIATYCLVAGGAVGGLITGGWWSLFLWHEFGNPIFPLFNGFFPSPELSDINILDRQFIPHGFLDGLAYPFYWLIGDHRSSEYPFRDARFATVLVLGAVAVGTRIVHGAKLFRRRDIQFLLFCAVSYATWLFLFSIQRYAVLLELLCGPLVVLLLVRILTRNTTPAATLRTWHLAIILTIATAAAGWTQPGDWSRRAWSNPYRPQWSARLQQPAVYILLDKPLAYLAPLLPPRSRFYQLADIALPVVPGGKFDRRIRAGLRDPLPGGIWELHLRGTSVRQELLDAYGLMIDGSQSCVDIEAVDPGSVVEACPVIARQRQSVASSR